MATFDAAAWILANSSPSKDATVKIGNAAIRLKTEHRIATDADIEDAVRAQTAPVKCKLPPVVTDLGRKVNQPRQMTVQKALAFLEASAQ